METDTDQNQMPRTKLTELESRSLRKTCKLEELANHTGTIVQTAYKNVTVANKLEKGIEIADSQTICIRRSPRLCKKANKSVQIKGDKKTTKQHVQPSTSNKEEQCPSPIDEYEIMLVEDDTLNTKQLTELLSQKGRVSKQVQEECRKICRKIQSQRKVILHVEATYTEQDQTGALFLVFATRNITIRSPWTTKIRVVNEFSEESRTMLNHVQYSALDGKASQKIAEIIEKYQESLMQKHKFLSSVSASSVASRKFGTKKHEILESPCIVLNVLVKGLIPLDEEPFPRLLEDIPTDVREGGFRFCGEYADTVLTNVRMGCKITSSNCPKLFGTLGGFIEHQEHGLCGITCAHIVLNDIQKKEVIERSFMTAKELTGDYDIVINQPCGNHEIGNLLNVTYKEGGNGKPGVDLALFKVKKRAPTTGAFPESRTHINLDSPKTYKTGLVCGKSGIPKSNMWEDKKVVKFGFKTENTEGLIQFDNVAVKEITFPIPKQQAKLFHQYHVKSDKTLFCKQGDSGALVFIEDKSGKEPELRCIGMIVGLFKGDNSCAVMPITAVLGELQVNQMKPFINNEMFDMIERRFTQTEEKADRRFDKMELRQSSLEEQTDRRFDQIELSHSNLEGQIDRRFDQIELSHSNLEGQIDRRFDRIELNHGERRNARCVIF